MNIGSKIKKLRKSRGLTQKELGLELGFPEGQADVRIAQYESGSRSPREEVLLKLASTLEVVPETFSAPNCNSLNELVHLLFNLEDNYGLKANIIENRLCLSFENFDNDVNNTELLKFLFEWLDKQNALKHGVITLEEYDDWRYKYSK